MTDITPNTFQCFNLYIDRALELLTDSEFRVLIYATRHIMGWQDKIKKRQGFISLTMFEYGYTTESGIYYGGCGLGRAAIIAACKSLVGFNLLAKVGDPTEDGQKWELTTSDIQWDKIEARFKEKKGEQKTRTIKATTAMMNKRAGTSDVPHEQTSLGGTSDVTMRSTMDVTMLGTSDVTESNPFSNPSSKPEENTNTSVSTGVLETSDSHPVEEKTNAVKQAEEHINKTVSAKSQRDLYQEAVKATFKIEFGALNGRIINFLTGSEKNKGEWKEWQIDEPPMTPIEIVAFGDWYSAAYNKAWLENGKKTPMTPQTVNTRILEFRAQHDYQRYVEKGGTAFMARMNAELTPPEPPKELPPPNKEYADKAELIIAAMARGEDISELIST